jgi:hypothetical protein
MFKARKKSLPPTAPTRYPSGICLESQTGFWYIKGQRRYKVPIGRILSSWNFAYVIETTEAALKNYKIAGTLGFRDGTLIKTIFDGKLYLVSENKRRPIKDPAVFDQLGFDRRAVVDVSESEANLHEIGEDLVGSNAL